VRPLEPGYLVSMEFSWSAFYLFHSRESLLIWCTGYTRRGPGFFLPSPDFSGFSYRKEPGLVAGFSIKHRPLHQRFPRSNAKRTAECRGNSTDEQWQHVVAYRGIGVLLVHKWNSYVCVYHCCPSWCHTRIVPDGYLCLESTLSLCLFLAPPFWDLDCHL